MTTPAQRTLTVCYGGTFDPVHCGHVAAAEDVLRRSGCDALHLVPCRVSPHRSQPRASGAQRLAMLRLAFAGSERVRIDAREIERPGPSFTVDTLAALRAELGPDAALGWVLGTDALQSLDRWHDWRRLPALAHLLVLDRPGAKAPETGPVADLLAARTVDEAAALRDAPAGRVWFVGQRPMAVSSTEVRALLADAAPANGSSDRRLDGLLPAKVWAYISDEGLYGVARQ